MENIYHERLHDDMISSGVHLIEMMTDSNTHREAIQLLKEYGNYMYGELGLIAGREHFVNDLKNFPGPGYLAPSGAFKVAMAGNVAAGCVGIRKFDEESCEMKRMYVRQAYRGRGTGRLLCNFVIDWCRDAGYRRILLDTNSEMKEAVILYNECGFKEIAAYCVNENDHPIYMEYIL